MVYVLGLIFCCYFILMGWLITGWAKSQRLKNQPSLSKPSVSVIVAMRDETKTIGFLIADLRAQTYKPFEIILVDDHSSDDTFTTVERLIAGDPDFRLIKSYGQGKKSALTTGITQARGEIIVTTDADCRMGHTWLSSVANAFAHDKVKMAFGPVAIHAGNSFFFRLQAIEFASAIGVGAATAAYGYPALCNGANLAFRKSVFIAAGGYDGNFHIPSGDDEFLMRKVLERYPTGVRYVPSKEAMVTTAPSPRLQDFLYQRLRWAGKWRHNSSPGSVALAIFMLLIQISVIAAITLATTGHALYIVLILLMVKVLLDFIFLYNVSTFLYGGCPLHIFIVLQVLYPGYVIGIGICSNFIPYRWKGRHARVTIPLNERSNTL